jgi:hypothetical protein
MPVDKLVPPDGITCVRCLEHGHHGQVAVEYVEKVDGNGLEALCVYCRDSDDCPGCAALDKENMGELKRLAKTVPLPVTGKDLKAADFAHPKESGYEVFDREARMDPLEKVGVSIPEALKLFKQGHTVKQLAGHFKVPAWRFQQSAVWTAARKGISQPAPGRKERKPHTRKTEPAEPEKIASTGNQIAALRAHIAAKVEAWQNVLKALDAAMLTFPE